MDKLLTNMKSLENLVYATGRLTKDAELGTTRGGRRFAKFTLASDKKPYRRSDKDKPTPNFIPVEIYGDEIVSGSEAFLKKGSSVELVGSIRTGSYENSQGKKFYTWKVAATGISALPEGAMCGMTAVVFTGKLHADARSTYTNRDNPVCVTDLFIEAGRRSCGGRDYIPASLYGKLGETLGRYLVKDQAVTVRGRLDTGSYVNSEKITVHTWRVIADDVYLVGNPLCGAEAMPAEDDGMPCEEPGFVDLPPEFDDEYFDD